MAPTGEPRGARARRRTASGEPDRASLPPVPPALRTWRRNPWVWTGAIILLAAVSLGLSVLVGTDANKPEPGDEDHSAFCEAVEQLVRDRPAGDTVTLDQPVEQFVRIRDDFARIVEISPARIRQTSRKLHESSAELAAEFERLTSSGQSLDKIPEAVGLLDRIDRKNATEAKRFSYYVERACGFDPSQPVTTTSSTLMAPTVDTVNEARLNGEN
ncbi:MAG: hypothetical protein N2037_08835 [Acidimicrobiales bacterium]|nr:hypothetical protein [Acidimicrobiales bacterium]